MRRGVCQIARDTNYAQSYVSQLFKRGLTEQEIRERARARGNKNTKASIAAGMGKPRVKQAERESDRGEALVEANRERAARGRTGETMFDVHLRKEIAIADQRELELQIRRSEMVCRHMMREWIAERYVVAKDVLLKIAPELKDRLAPESDPVRIEMIIQGEVEVALRHVGELVRELANEAQAAA